MRQQGSGVSAKQALSGMILLLESRIPLNIILQKLHTSSQIALEQIATDPKSFTATLGTGHGNSRILHMPLVLYSML